MNYFEDFTAYDNKLGELLTGVNLIHKFDTSHYPITMTIYPDVSPAAQMEMFATSDDGATSRDARLIFSFPVGEIGVKMIGRLVLSDDLLNKIKGIAKKMHKAYLEGFFAERHQLMTSAVTAEPEEEEEPVDFSEFMDDESEDE